MGQKSALIAGCNVTGDFLIEQAIESFRAANGVVLDILVNNSGGGHNMPLLDSQVAVAKKMSYMNLFGLVAVTQAFAPLLIASRESIVNIGSYKAAVNLLTDQLPIELSTFSVTEVADTMVGELAFKNAINVQAYAEEVAKNVIKSSPKKIRWLGGDVFLIWLAGAFGWATTWASPVSGFT
ncbi:hypothetical protein NA56DRAFT_680464 [Hyaloscypha hepaticicola]|uniref:NAD(P)-binding protein n=1 Tax=Hyaloscypha hepaticicola TaxID=2082293 RepID=A0A2J6PYW1_9HELO|nr:hypothetical protein NA56DRAFT_680464 [Hyaloscypha hepaticicola]